MSTLNYKDWAHALSGWLRRASARVQHRSSWDDWSWSTHGNLLLVCYRSSRNLSMKGRMKKGVNAKGKEGSLSSEVITTEWRVLCECIPRISAYCTLKIKEKIRNQVENVWSCLSQRSVAGWYDYPATEGSNIELRSMQDFTHASELHVGPLDPHLLLFHIQGGRRHRISHT